MVPRLLLRLACAGGLLAMARAGALDTPTVFNHDDPAIHYSAVAARGDHAECTMVPNPCANEWWVEPNEGGTASRYPETHTTSGTTVSFSFAFHGSTAVAIIGKRDSNVQPSIVLNGRPSHLSNTQDGEIFVNQALDSSMTYTMEVSYHGIGTLSVAAILLDRNGVAGAATVSTSSSPTSQSSSSTTISTSISAAQSSSSTTSQPEESSSVETSSSHSSTEVEPTTSSNDETTVDPSSSITSGATSSTASTSSAQASASSGASNGQSPSGPDGSSSSSNNSGSKGKSKAGVIVGALIAAILLLFLLALGGLYLRRRMHARRAPSYAFRSGNMPWAPGDSPERVPQDWEAFPSGGTSTQNVTGHESFVIGMASPPILPSTAETSTQTLTHGTITEDRVGLAA